MAAMVPSNGRGSSPRSDTSRTALRYRNHSSLESGVDPTRRSPVPAGGTTVIPIEAAVERYLERKSGEDGTTTGSGTYTANASSILTRWVDWLADEYDVRTTTELERAHLAAYARDLADRTERGECTASTATTYFAVVRAFLSWCRSVEICETNPAADVTVDELFPTTASRTDTQHWTPEARRQLESHVRSAVSAAPGDSTERLARLREWAMVALLAHAGLRGAELFRVPADDRRSGATWDDVDFYAGTVTVLGTGHRLEAVTLPAAARTPLRRYRVALDPPTVDWPLFPTHHAPSVADRVRAELGARGYDEAAIEELFATSTAIELARIHAIAPPALTTEGARTILKRLCAAASVDVDGEYLKPGGARRAYDGTGSRTPATRQSSGIRTSDVERSLVAVDVDDRDEEGEDDGDTDTADEDDADASDEGNDDVPK